MSYIGHFPLRGAKAAVAAAAGDMDLLSTPLLTVAIIVSLCLVFAVALGAFLTVFFSRRSRKFLAAHDANIRFFTYDRQKGTVYGFDRNDFGDAKEVSIDEFIRQFSADNGQGGEGRRVQAWLDSLLTDSKTRLFYQTGVRISAAHTRKEAVLKVDNVNVREGRVHFESMLLANTNIARSALKRPFPGHILDYSQYLSGFRALLSNKKQVTFFFVSLPPNPQALHFMAEGTQKEYLIVLFADYLSRILDRNRYIVTLDSSSLMLVDLKKTTPSQARTFAAGLRTYAQAFLTINGLDDRYSTKVGITIHSPKTTVMPLKDYVVQSSQAADMGLETRPSRIVIFSSSSPARQAKNTHREIIENMVRKRMWRLYYTPVFDLRTGVPEFYVLKMKPFGSEIPIGAPEFLNDVWRLDMITELGKAIAEQVTARAGLTATRKKILIPLRLAFIAQLDKALALSSVGKDVQIMIGLFEKDTELYEGPRLEESIKKLSELGIDSILIMRGRANGIVDSTMRLFAGIMLDRQTGASWTKEQRLDTLVALETIKHYGKPIALAGLANEDECYFAKAHNVNLASSETLCKPSSYMETIDLNGRSIIEKLNNVPILGRVA